MTSNFRVGYTWCPVMQQSDWEHEMNPRSILMIVIWLLFEGAVKAEQPSLSVGRQTILIPAGRYNTTHFPDQPISVLSEQPLSVLMVCGVGTKLFYGRNWETITFADYVLQPGQPNDFDGGYAGIGGVHRDGATLYALYHAENHIDKSSDVAKARNQFAGMFSVGLALSQDDGKSFQKKGQVLSSSHPYQQGRECGGLGDITVCPDRTKTHLLAYYADFSRGQGKGVQICMARCAINDKAMPGSWKKYHNGSFNEPGLGGKETYVLSLADDGADAWCPHVTYSADLDRYFLTFAATYNNETDGQSFFRPVKSGIYIASSQDGIHWSEPVLAFRHSVLLIKGSPGAMHPTLYLEGKKKDGVKGTLFYAYTPDWATTPHHLAARQISISLIENNQQRDLKTVLAGTKWINSNKVSFEWTKDGRVLHAGKDREWKVLDQNRAQIVFGPGHVDTFEFDDSMKTFKQLIKGGPTFFTGRRQ